ncbi:MAG: hypothetical protein HY051_04415 [Candidatus Aenigmarchaeota archaeon]|nr:hypothetical protein [Candidatus Aenigmarchaeota archaeon]
MEQGALGYACGVLCGRGFIRRGRNNCVGIQTSSRRLAEEFSSSLRGLIGYEILPKAKTISGKEYFTVNAYGKNVVGIFDAIDFRPTRRGWSPPRLTEENREFRLGFLAGFFDATSFVYFNREKFYASGGGYRYVRVTSVNPNGLAGIRKLLGIEGVECAFRTRRGLAYLVLRGRWRLDAFMEKVALRTEKKISLEQAAAASGSQLVRYNKSQYAARNNIGRVMDSQVNT